MHHRIPENIALAINSPISSANFHLVEIVSRELNLKYRHVHPQHQYLDSIKYMSPTEISATLSEYRKPARPSGITWELQFDIDGRNIEGRSPQWGSPFNPEAQVVWQMSVCLRAPFFIFLELKKVTDGSWTISQPESKEIQDLANTISTTIKLSPISGAYLNSISVDPQLIREPIYLRMDYTEEPNAYQLLVEE